MKTRKVLLGVALSVVVSIRLMGAYAEKTDNNTQPQEQTPVGAGQKAQTMSNYPDELYPYYGNTPDDMVPFKDVEPVFRYWTKRLPFRGPGRDYPEPTDLKSLKVGLLTPAKYGPEGKRGQGTKEGVLLAFEEANASRKPGELPFEIIEREDSPQWGSAANIAVEFKDNDVLGYIGTIDGDATHVALRVTLKTETFIINTSDPDPTLTETQIPWLIRIFPDDRQQCFRLANIIVRERGCKRIAVYRESSRPGRVGVMHFINYIRRLGCPAVAHLLYKPGSKDISSQLNAIKSVEPDAVLFYGQPEDIGYAVATFRKAGIKAQFFGFDRLMEDEFAKTAGEYAEGMTITYFFDMERKDQKWLDFVQRFEKRWGHKPCVYAAYGYDGAKLMIEAINKCGPNRFKIRDYLAGLDEWDGITGHMIFDGRWDNIAPIGMAEYKNSKWHYRPLPEIKPVKISQQAATQGVLQPATQ
ncbi:MAG: ABC transporter substrate-binding protein [Verrucomicrobiae bacterium]|nr:ABC transporter substrate-binding protein [Verrucomicrobiae bacterium]